MRSAMCMIMALLVLGINGCTTKTMDHTSYVLPSGDMPLAYDRECTGAEILNPTLPSFADLPSIPYLPDPFLMDDGTHMTTRAQWKEHRTEAARIDVLTRV